MASVALPDNSSLRQLRFECLRDIASQERDDVFGAGEFERRLGSAAAGWLECLADAERDSVLRTKSYSCIETQAHNIEETLRSQGQRRAASDILAEHLLPRYAWWRTAKSAWAGPVAKLVPAAFVTAAAAAFCFLALGVGETNGMVWAARSLASGYAVGVIVALWEGPVVLYPLALRIPAGAAVGMAGLLSTSNWFGASHPWTASLALIVTFYGYAAFDCRTHLSESARTGRGALVVASLRRAVIPTALAVVHGVAVALLALTTVGRQVFAVSAEATRQPLELVVFAGSLAVTIGTVVQILWSDRTILAPLDRTTWKGR